MRRGDWERILEAAESLDKMLLATNDRRFVHLANEINDTMDFVREKLGLVDSLETAKAKLSS